mgnify:CR=1 FL=1
MEYEFHRFSEFIPLMTGIDFEAFKASIKLRGQLHPIILYDGKILDGRLRYVACRELGITPKFEQSKSKDDFEALLEWESRNLIRHHRAEEEED